MRVWVEQVEQYGGYIVTDYTLKRSRTDKELENENWWIRVYLRGNPDSKFKEMFEYQLHMNVKIIEVLKTPYHARLPKWI